VLTPEDAAAVLRRAAELDTPSLEQHDGLEEDVLRAAAREVGLSDGAVDQAVREWRSGALAPLPPVAQDSRLALPGFLFVTGPVDLPAPEADRRLSGFLREQWFEHRRARGPEAEWAPRRGPLASARRAADLDRRLRLRAVGRLRVCVVPAGEGSRVRLVADLRETRGNLLSGMVAAPAAVTAAGLGAAAVLPAGTSVPELLLALPAAAGVGALGWLGARRTLDSRRTEVAEELERVLATLATAASRSLQERAAAWAAERLPWVRTS
jgi:hypothetical protein